jgi:predicted glutamine amidotransferase
MCVIIYKQANAIVCPSVIKYAYDNNPHGFGLMYAEDKQVKVIKGLYDLTQIYNIWNNFLDKDIAVHFRWATVGKISEENLHPFPLMNKAEDKKDLYLMHNGTIRDLPFNENVDLSDTNILVNILKEKIKKEGLFSVLSDKRLTTLGKAIGKSKLLLMDDTNKIRIVNKEMGVTVGDVWFSNQYSLTKDYRKNLPKSDIENWLTEDTVKKFSTTTYSTPSIPSVPATPSIASKIKGLLG